MLLQFLGDPMLSADQLREIVAEALSVAPDLVGDDIPFDTLPDYDSVARLGLLMALADAGIELDFAQAAEFGTFGELLRLVDGRVSR